MAPATASCTWLMRPETCRLVVWGTHWEVGDPRPTTSSLRQSACPPQRMVDQWVDTSDSSTLLEQSDNFNAQRQALAQQGSTAIHLSSVVELTSLLAQR